MITIRKCTAHDLDNLYLLEITSFFGNSPESKETIADRLSCYLDGCIVILVNNKFAGALLSELWLHEENNYNKFKLNHNVKDAYHEKGNELYISTVAIMPEYQGMKLANKLLDYFVNEMLIPNPRINLGSLVVSANWPKAIHLYKKYGFVEHYRVNDFFEENNAKYDGIIMYHQK